jgi:hypothetical protein
VSASSTISPACATDVSLAAVFVTSPIAVKSLKPASADVSDEFFPARDPYSNVDPTRRRLAVTGCVEEGHTGVHGFRAIRAPGETRDEDRHHFIPRDLAQQPFEWEKRFRGHLVEAVHESCCLDRAQPLGQRRVAAHVGKEDRERDDRASFGSGLDAACTELWVLP